MPYRPKDIYRGRRKFRVPLNIFLFVLAALIFGGVAMFYILQQYMVYDADGATLQLPFGQEKEASVGDELLFTPEPTFEPLQVQVIWENPDFEDVDLGTWDDLSPMKGWFISANTLQNAGDLEEAITIVQAGGFDTAVLEMKSRSGQLVWQSASPTAVAYGTYGSTDVSAAIETLHGSGVRVAAQISCLADALMAQRNWTCALQTGGSVYRDGDGIYWLDPYNRTVRTYLIELASELATMGFDEIILADLYHPISDESFTYTVTLQAPADPIVAVCQAGRRVAEALEGSGVAVSARLNTASLREGLSARSGQDLDIFWRLFARLYCPTSADMLVSDAELAAADMNGGDENVRFVPVVGVAPEASESYLISG